MSHTKILSIHLLLLLGAIAVCCSRNSFGGAADHHSPIDRVKLPGSALTQREAEAASDTVVRARVLEAAASLTLAIGVTTYECKVKVTAKIKGAEDGELTTVVRVRSTFGGESPPERDREYMFYLKHVGKERIEVIKVAYPTEFAQESDKVPGTN